MTLLQLPSFRVGGLTRPFVRGNASTCKQRRCPAALIVVDNLLATHGKR